MYCEYAKTPKWFLRGQVAQMEQCILSETPPLLPMQRYLHIWNVLIILCEMRMSPRLHDWDHTARTGTFSGYA